MTQFFSKSPDETISFAEKFAKTLNGGEVIAFRGNLGMGKTCFTRGLALGLEYSGNVTSPTFALVNEYLGGKFDIFHFDMYRISSWDELYSSGYFEYLEQGGIVVLEWSENIENALPDNTIYIELESIDENTRKITIHKKEENL